MFKRAIRKTTVTLLLTTAMVVLALDTAVGANDFTRYFIRQTAFRQSNMDISPLQASEDSAKAFVDPKDSIYYTWEKRLNDTIAVNVTIANMTGFAGLEFELYWNATLLNCTSFTENLFHTATPQSSWNNIWQLKKKINNTGGYVEYAFTYLDTNQAIQDGYAPINMTGANYPEGKLAAASLTFAITNMPPENSYVDCLLRIVFHETHDIQGNVILVDVIDGYYKLISSTGDMNGDHTVDIYDAMLLSSAFGSDPASSNWNPKADLNNDDEIDIFDALVLAASFGKTVS